MLILNELHPEYEQVSSLPQGCDEMSPLVEEYTFLPSQRSSLTDITVSIYTSAPSRFIVDGKSLYIHRQLVSRHSQLLSAKIKAKNEFTIIDGVDKDTFTRFVEWAYKGYYTAAEYRIDDEAPSLSKFEDSDTCTPETEPSPSSEDALAPPPTEPEPEPELNFGWGGFGSKMSKKIGKKPTWVWDESAPAEPAPAEYAPAEYAPADAPADAPAEPTPEPELAFGCGGFSSKKSKKTGKKTKLMTEEPVPEPQALKSSKDILKESFYARKYETRIDTITISSPRPNEEPNENYTPVFLSHAHLYVFARKYDIPPLEALALENLHMTLDRFTLHPERTGDIVELLRYIYGSQEFPREAEEMREMLRGYIGFQMDVLLKDRDFRGLMKEEGELLDDFVEMVGKRI